MDGLLNMTHTQANVEEPVAHTSQENGSEVKAAPQATQPVTVFRTEVPKDTGWAWMVMLGNEFNLVLKNVASNCRKSEGSLFSIAEHQ